MPISLATLQSKIPKEIQNPTNAELIKDYDNFHEINRISDSQRTNRIKLVMYYSQWLAAKYPEMTLYDVNNRDLHILPFLNKYRKSAKDDPEEKWVTTWNDYRSRLIHFFRWLHNVRIKEKASDEVPIEAWETPSFMRIKKQITKRKNTYSISETWERDEVLTILPYELDVRNKAMIAALWDIDGRNHELTRMKNKNVRYKEKYAEGEIPFQTKTGGGPVVLRMSFAYLLEWKNKHPLKNDPEAPLFCIMRSDKLGEPLTPDYVWRITDNLKKRIKKLVESGAIKDTNEREELERLLREKRWNPYCFRTSAIRHDSVRYHQQALNQKVRWVPNSKQPSRYIAQTLSIDVKNMILANDGIITEETKPQAVNRTCPKCGLVNPLENNLCSNAKCGYPLTEKAYHEIKDEEKMKNDVLKWMFENKDKLGTLMTIVNLTNTPLTTNIDHPNQDVSNLVLSEVYD